MTASTFPLDVPLELLRERTSIKWRHYGPEVLPMWVAELDVRTAPPIASAVERALRLGDTGYTSGRGLQEAIADFARAEWSWDVSPGRSALMPDVMLGVAEALRLISAPGDAVIVTPPVYPPFFAFARDTGRAIVDAPLDDDWRLDLEALDRAFVEARAHGRGAVLLLCNPHNPTGTVHTRAELEAVLALAAERGVRVLSDEIHAPLTAVGTAFTPLLDVAGAEHAYALHSASKAWNLPGLKVAVLFGGAETDDELALLPEIISHGPAHIATIAHTAAYAESRDWLQSLRHQLDQRRTELHALLATEAPDVGYAPAAATYLAWLDFSRTSIAGPVRDERDAPSAPARALLGRGRLAAVDGEAFGIGGANHVRLNIGCSPEVLADGVSRIRTALDPDAH